VNAMKILNNSEHKKGPEETSGPSV